MKKRRQIHDLRYRLRKKGYRFPYGSMCGVMPDDEQQRSHIMERHAIAMGFSIQYNMLHLFRDNMGGGSGLLLVVFIAVSLLKIDYATYK